jgi:uncharacterized membrane protein
MWCGVESLTRPAAHGPAVATRPRAPAFLVEGAAGTRAWHWLALLSMVGIAWSAFAWALLAIHRGYNSNAFDLGFFDQIIWNTSQGRWFQTSFVDYNFLGQHMEPVLLIYAGLYRLWPAVELLLLTQATVVAWAAVPLFYAARRLLASATAAVLVAGCYLFAPHVHGAVLFDFHPEVMGAAGIFGAFALLAAGRPGWAIAALATVYLLKEDAALAGAGFAVTAWLLGHRRLAAGLVVASLLYLLLVVGVLMPAIRGGPGDLQDRYGYLGDDSRAVVLRALRRPDIVARRLVEPPQRRALAYITGTTALLPLLSPAAVAALPLLATNLLSTHPAQRDLTLHYPALAYALLLVATVLGIRALAMSPRLEAVRRRLRLSPGGAAVCLAGVLLAAETVAWALGSPLGPRRFDAERYQRTEHHAAVARVLAAVSDGAPLSAQSGLLPHLSQRRHVWEFPRLEHAEYIVVDPSAWRSSQAHDAGYDEVLRSLPSLGYCPLLTEDGVTLYGRGARCASPS